MFLTRPLQATIELAALRHNLDIVRGCAPKSRVLAVIKAAAYGHGALRVARALADAGVDGFGLLELDTAVRLREAGIRQRIVLLEGFFNAAELPVLARHRIDTALHAREHLDLMAKAQDPLNVLMKLNTGMNRLGFVECEFKAAWQRLRGSPAINELTLMTHFANADDARGVDWQMQAFNRMTAGIDVPRTLANSAAIVRYPQTHADWVRPGIMLYGATPFAEVSAEALGLKPVMTLTSQIIAVQHLKKGGAVGYGGAYVAQRDTRIGVVACGYADGYPRHAPSGTPVRVGNAMTGTVGRVSMDMLCVDLTVLPQAGVGSKVTLWGVGNPVDDVATAAGTVGYELLCALAPRVPIVVQA